MHSIDSFLGAVDVERLELDLVLATVLFTDIVGSTQKAAEIGDRAWRQLLERQLQLAPHNVCGPDGTMANSTLPHRRPTSASSSTSTTSRTRRYSSSSTSHQDRGGWLLPRSRPTRLGAQAQSRRLRRASSNRRRDQALRGRLGTTRKLIGTSPESSRYKRRSAAARSLSVIGVSPPRAGGDTAP